MSTPRIHLVDLHGPLPPDDPYGYDPSAAVRAELNQPDEIEQIRELAARLDRAYESDVRDARRRSLPATVAAYREVFGVLPEGWPHPDM